LPFITPSTLLVNPDAGFAATVNENAVISFDEDRPSFELEEDDQPVKKAEIMNNKTINLKK